MSERALLARLCRGPATGPELAREAGLSRAAVWKRVQALRAAGVEVEATPGRGYALRRPLALLDADALRAALAPATRAGIASLEVAFDCDSTNAEAMRTPAPGTGVRVLFAERQLAGRGRRGRAWQSPLAAHLYLSLSRRLPGGVAALQGLSLAAGVAVAAALHRLGHAEAGLKWPNDLMARGRKLGGLLVELGGDATGEVQVVLGLGLNVAMPATTAAAIDQPWIDLAALSPAPPSRPAVAVAVLDALVPLLAGFEHEGADAALAEWPRYDVLTGRAVRVQCGERVHEGVALGLAADGALRLRTAGGEQSFHAGEASLRAA